MDIMKKTMIAFMSFFFIHIPFSSSVQAAPGVSAHSAVLMEAESGRVLYEKNPHEQRSIASITKILTAIVAIEYGKLDDEVTISERAERIGGSSIYLEKGETVKLKDLLYGLMLRSGNDAAIAISEHIGGSVEGFVHIMNEKAKWIGMNHSHFANPHGLDQENHYSTAYDMALLMRYAIKNDTFRKIAGTVSYQSESETYPWRNKNKLLTRYYEYCTGGKTGFTSQAGRTLVSSAEKENMKLIMVTLNASDDWNDHRNIYEWAYETFDLIKIGAKGELTIPLPDGKTVEGFRPHAVYVPLSEKEEHEITNRILIDENFADKRNSVIGKQVFQLEGDTIAESNIWFQPKESGKTSWIDRVKSIFLQMIGVL
ncbi:D-alanyl-D-alanine carboxypeptidase [Melghiribacillus thermohalophilus]|uniref:D-alanyl-D-alanine carboxypeptidase n=2 Tax=Melghiribacillus thermohalophilus TaxID=1324956 RepID=A0A4R3NAF7_9BACI|nr:D-alanyl-D-alanine carboxypeptidase [Melghiribacillus thermohalophilus]